MKFEAQGYLWHRLSAITTKRKVALLLHRVLLRALIGMLHPPLLRAMTRSCILVFGLRPAYRPAPLARSVPWYGCHDFVRQLGARSIV